MINCKLNRDIALAGSTGGCMSVTINVGLADGLYIFNLEDVENLIFDGDTRPDSTLLVNTIVTSQPYYRVDATNINYTQEYDDHSYTHQLTADIKNVRNEIEEVLESAVHGKYLVAFKVIGESNYRLVGWKEGLSLDQQLNISSENNAFTLTFNGVTTYPEMEVDKFNFNLAEKVFEPTFEATFVAGKVVCTDGWAVAQYVAKVNAAGLPLDEDNKLCQYSGKPQDAYKLESASDGGYNIIGTYTSETYSVEGKTIKKYDDSLCTVTCSLSISPTSLELTPSNSALTVTVTSDGDWELASYPSYVSLSQTEGVSGSTNVIVYSDENCGNETLTFKNKNGGCTANLGISNNFIKVDNVYYFENNTSTATIYPVACSTYSGNTTEGTLTVNSDSSFTVANIPTSTNQKEVTVTLTSGSVSKDVTLIIYGKNTARGRRAISEFCVTEEEEE